MASTDKTPYLETFKGKKFPLLSPGPEDIDIDDIAHALSNQCRYGGRCQEFYSVAQHSVLVSMNVVEGFEKEAFAHDFSEAYLVDIPRPIKYLPEMKPYRDMEASLSEIIGKKFGVPGVMSPEVATADNNICVTEMSQICVGDRYKDLLVMGYKLIPGLEIQPLLPKQAESLFLARYYELFS